MRFRAAIRSAVLISSLISVFVPAWAASGMFNRAAYLAQAAKTGPDEIVARNFLATAAAPSRFFDEKSLIGPGAPAVVAWLGNAHEHCTPPGTEIELDCRTRGLVDAAQMVYIDSPDRTRQWAVVTLHTSPDSGNVGYERIVLFRKGASGYDFHAVADARGYQPGNFADDDGRMTYVGFTGTSGEAIEGKGPRQRFRIVGEGDAATVVEDSPALKRRSAPSNRSKAITGTVPTRQSLEERVSASMAANGGSDAYTADHNGSLVRVSPSLGTIAYIHPRPGMDRMVGIGTVMFRGWFTQGTIAGTAYVFRNGCAPAPYAVTGTGYSGPGSAFVLIGHPPIRAPGSCTVVGYGDNANSVLHFEPREEGDI